MIKQPRHRPEATDVEVGLYVHVAFCRSICFYCDFNTYAGQGSLIPRYVDALAGEIAMLPTALPGVREGVETGENRRPGPSPETTAATAVCPDLKRGPTVASAGRSRFRIGSIFFGGGTPSLLTPEQVERVLAAARRWPVVDGAEISLEANPGDLSPEHLRALREVGVNRLSLGVQSFDDAMLRRLGRRHDAATAVRAFRQAREAGFDNVSLDLMFALPGQTLAHWDATLQEALALGPEHLSLYNLTVEPGTPFGAWAEAGRLSVPDDDAAADMYQAAIDRLGAAGYAHYEISNWALVPPPGRLRRGDRGTRRRGDAVVLLPVSPRRPIAASGTAGRGGRDFRAQHNLRYWRNQPYFGVGAGAHSSFGGYRYANLRLPTAYVARVEAGESPVDGAEQIDRALEMGETMMLGLRLAEGVSIAAFDARFGCSPRDAFGPEIAELTAVGLLTTDDGQIHLTPRGRFLGNEVFCRFLGASVPQ